MGLYSKIRKLSRKRFVISRLLRRRQREKLLERHGVGVVADTRNGMLIVEAGDFSVGRHLLRHGEYDWSEIQWLKRQLDPERANVLVVGSHVGALVVPLSRCCRNMIAFEADRTNFRLLELNVRLNACGNVALRNQAVGESNRYVSMQRNLVNTGNTSVSCKNESGDTQMVRLDDCLDMQPVDLMVMDIEGYEPQALEGAEQVLQHTKMLYVELAPTNLEAFGNSTRDLLDLAYKYFPCMYDSASGEEKMYTKEQAIEWICQLDAAHQDKGYMRNLLFTREPL